MSHKLEPSSFIYIAELGKGSFGEVFLVRRRGTNEKYAMKILDKDIIIGQNIIKYVLTERNVLTTLHHPFIVKLNYAFQTKEKLFLLLDYCSGGDLSKQIQYEGKFKESKAKFYICEIILAIGELHKKDIIFRDLKPDNIVLNDKGHALLTDFGLSKEGVNQPNLAKSFCGSIAYLAPEILTRKGHGKAVDWYLIGVVFYEMLVGLPPFFHRDKKQIFRNISSAEIQFPDFVSEKAASFIQQLLIKDPLNRLGSNGDVEEIKKHDYFSDVDWNKVYNQEISPPSFSVKANRIKVFDKPQLFEDSDSYSNKEEDVNNNKIEGWSFVENSFENNDQTV